MDYRQLFPPRAAVLNSEHAWFLRTLLGGHCARRLLPVLEKVVQWYLDYNESATADHAFEVADDRAIRDACRRVAQPATALRQSLQLMAARWPNGSLATEDGLVVTLADAILQVKHIEASARRFHDQAAEALRPPKGRPGSNRVVLSAVIVDVFRAWEWPVAKSRDGKYARVLELAYEAAGLDVPKELFRDITAALSRADQHPVDSCDLEQWGVGRQRRDTSARNRVGRARGRSRTSRRSAARATTAS